MSDYSCQEHGKDTEQGCVACELAKDFSDMEATITKLEDALKRLGDDDVEFRDKSHHNYDPIDDLQDEIEDMKKYARATLKEKEPEN